MKGLEISRRFFFDCALPILQKECGKILPKMACGLVGEGSDCFGFDDEWSRDHDWGPRFCIWLTREDFLRYGADLQRVYDNLPNTFLHFQMGAESRWGNGRNGVQEIGSFYQKFLGEPQPPQQLKKWIFIPENALATAVNGEVFQDPLGEFTAIRRELLRGYPRDIRLIKLAACCMKAGQAGQYNYIRSVRRKERYAVGHSEIIFLDSVISIIFLLNNRYAPFYKWGHRAVALMPLLGDKIAKAIDEVMDSSNIKEKEDLFENIATLICDQLRKEQLTSSPSNFLPDHGAEIQSRIQDSEIAKLNILAL